MRSCAFVSLSWLTARFRAVRRSLVSMSSGKRIDIVRPDSAMSLEAFAKRYQATVPPKTLAVINGLETGARLEPGRSYKVVRGGELP